MNNLPIPIFIDLPILTDTDFLSDTDSNLGGGVYFPPYLAAQDQGSWYQIPLKTNGDFIFLQNQMNWPYIDIDLRALDL